MTDVSPEIGPDGRVRPRYGEYATPEEQRARIRQPDASQSLEAGQAPAHSAQTPPAPVPSAAAVTRAPAPKGMPAPTGRPLGMSPTRPHPIDRIATFALLAYGAINVILSAGTYFDLPTLADRAMSVLGIEGEFTNLDAANVWGPIAAVTLVVGYTVTAVLALRSLRRGRVSWWIPVAGAALTFLLVSACLAVPLFGDPAFVQYLTPTP